MPDDDPGRLARALAVTERLQWYVCPRGHPYTVGECGKPMQVSHCTAPGCGAAIGGSNHVSSSGNKATNAFQGAGTPFRGYRIDEASHYEVVFFLFVFIFKVRPPF